MKERGERNVFFFCYVNSYNYIPKVTIKSQTVGWFVESYQSPTMVLLTSYNSTFIEFAQPCYSGIKLFYFSKCCQQTDSTS